MIHVALVEDDEDFQVALTLAMEMALDMKLIGVAGTRTQGLRMLEQAQADVLLVDLGLPDGSGIDVVRAAHLKWPGCNIMVSTTFGDEAHVMQSLEAGACGYLLKDSAPHKLVSEIRNLHAGGSPISPLIARQILMRFRQLESSAKPLVEAHEPPRQRATLSTREREVLGYITKGFTSNEIAMLMSISFHSVQTYVRRIYEKLSVRSKSEAIYEARYQGLLGE